MRDSFLLFATKSIENKHIFRLLHLCKGYASKLRVNVSSYAILRLFSRDMSFTKNIMKCQIIIYSITYFLRTKNSKKSLIFFQYHAHAWCGVFGRKHMTQNKSKRHSLTFEWKRKTGTAAFLHAKFISFCTQLCGILYVYHARTQFPIRFMNHERWNSVRCGIVESIQICVVFADRDHRHAFVSERRRKANI